jgi:hypothetical protein
MCLGGSPQAPDPVATAQAQNAVNKDALITASQLNQINQTGPFGSVSYSGQIGSPDRTQTTTLSPELRALFNGQLGASGSLTDLANQRLAGAPRTDFQLPQNPSDYLTNSMVSPLKTYGDTSVTAPKLYGEDSVSPLQRSVATTGGNFTTGVNAQPLQYGFDSGGQTQRSLDFSGAPSLNTDFSGLAKQAQDANYASQTQYLDPQFAQSDQALASKLAAQGITQGSDAYNTAMDNAARQKQAAYSDARNQSIMAGDAQANALFGQNLAARQQGVGEATTQGNFANAALAQQFAQNQGQAGFYNAAQAQGFGQGMQNAQLNNQAQNDIFGQNLAAGGFANDATTQQLNNGLALQNYNNNASSQHLSDILGLQQYNNQALGQQFQQGMQVNDYNNQLYNNNIQNQILGRNQNINEAMSYLGGTPISGQQYPTYQPIAQSTAAQSSPDAVSLAGSNYNAQQQARAAILGSIFGSVGRIGGAALGAK